MKNKNVPVSGIIADAADVFGNKTGSRQWVMMIFIICRCAGSCASIQYVPAAKCLTLITSFCLVFPEKTRDPCWVNKTNSMGAPVLCRTSKVSVSSAGLGKTEKRPVVNFPVSSMGTEPDFFSISMIWLPDESHPPCS